MILFKDEWTFQRYVEKNLVNKKKSDYGYWNQLQNRYNLKGTNKLENFKEIISILQKWELLYSINERVPGINEPVEFRGYLFDDIKYKHRLDTFGTLDGDIAIFKLLSINQACEFLSTSRPTVYKLIKEGKLKTVSFFGQKRIQMKVLLEFIQDHTIK